MAEKINISFPTYVLETIDRTKPKGMGRSEYMAGLIMKQIMQEASPPINGCNFFLTPDPSTFKIEYLNPDGSVKDTEEHKIMQRLIL